ncbi:MAG: hypothetical protein IKV87_02365 [Methanobrevibacter sp.]|nr:hypothetical protein [Methanobrevibacter sp.]
MILKIEMCPTKIKTIQQLNDAVGEDYLTLRVCIYEKKFLNTVKKFKKSEMRDLMTRMRYILEYPQRGKHMSYNRYGQLEAYVGSFRLYYEYYEKENKVIFCEFSHKNYQ